MNNFWKNKKVVVTGASGFIGSRVVRLLVEKESQVTASISPNTDSDRFNQLKSLWGKVDIRKADLLNFSDCINITKGQDVVLNFAAMDGGATFKQKYSAKILKTNTELVLHMLDAAVKNKVDRFLLMSSIEVYPQSARIPIREQYSLKENFKEEANGYTWSKRFGEIAAKMYAREYGLKIAIARPGNVYGPGDVTGVEKGRVIPTFINKIMQGEEIELVDGGKQKKQFLYVTDLVDALLDLTEKYAVCDPINLTGTEVITIKALSQIIKSLSQGQQIPKIFTKRNIGKIISTQKAEKVIAFLPKVDLIQGLERTYLTIKGS